MNTSSENIYKCLFYGILFIFLTIILLLLLNKKKEKYTCVPSISITPANSSHIIQVDPNTGDLSEINTNSILNAVNQNIDSSGTFSSIIINGTIKCENDILLVVSTTDTILQSDKGTNRLSTNYTLVINDMGINNANNLVNGITNLKGINDPFTATSGYVWSNDNNGNTWTHGVDVYSIITSRPIIATYIFAYSDERIKNNITDIDTKNALDIIRKIQPKRYTYKDILNKGDKPEWGFIAQQVKSLIENSTNIVTEFIPDIYELAQVLDYNIIKLDINTTINFEINEKIRLVKNDGKYLDTKITCVLDNYTFTIEENINQEQIFVYGREVHDLNTLNKDCIFTIATSALKEVDKELQNEKILRQQLENRIEIQDGYIKKQNEIIEKQINDIRELYNNQNSFIKKQNKIIEQQSNDIRELYNNQNSFIKKQNYF